MKSRLVFFVSLPLRSWPKDDLRLRVTIADDSLLLGILALLDPRRSLILRDRVVGRSIDLKNEEKQW